MLDHWRWVVARQDSWYKRHKHDGDASEVPLSLVCDEKSKKKPRKWTFSFTDKTNLNHGSFLLADVDAFSKNAKFFYDTLVTSLSGSW